MVFKAGRAVAENGRHIPDPFPPGDEAWDKPRPLNMAALTAEQLRIPHAGGRARIIEIVPGQITTRMRLEEVVPTEHGDAVSDVGSDFLKLVVVERHRATGRRGLGLVAGFGLQRGAMASSVAHDSHNVIAVGVTDDALVLAIETVRNMGGGIAVVSGRNELLSTVPLPIGGLMSNKPIDFLADQCRAAKAAAAVLGCGLEEPFMALSFLALPVIPRLRVTDKGLVDVEAFEVVPLFEGLNSEQGCP
jgi:adenine deaminase